MMQNNVKICNFFLYKICLLHVYVEAKSESQYASAFSVPLHFFQYLTLMAIRKLVPKP